MERTVICHSNVNEMKRKRYCCDGSRQMYEDYYTGQVCGNMPMFRCVRYQRGHGLANVISGLFRRVVLPFLKKEQKDVYQKCVQNWNGSGRRCTGEEVKKIIIEDK